MRRVRAEGEGREGEEGREKTHTEAVFFLAFASSLPLSLLTFSTLPVQ